ncbi:MAG: dihydroorotate dehydrogenase electron transfer subunit [Chloroflexota bacterium]
MKQTLCPVTSNVEVMPDIHLMWVEAPDMAVAAQPGQFITVRCGDCTLRRPLSIHQSSPLTGEDSGEGEIALLFKIAGKGSLWLSQRQTGDRIDILGPLGRGYSIEPGAKKLLLVAGGIGIAPLVFLMQYASSQHQITLIHGVSTAAQLYPSFSGGKKRSGLPPLPKEVQFVPVTEDGSMGEEGLATDILPDFLDWADQVYACGPAEMYKAMADLSLRVPIASGRSNLKLKGEGKTVVGEALVPSHNIKPNNLAVGEGLVPSRNLKLRKCQVSLEVRMGCGFGACYSCTINTKNGLKQVCRDGPVFELKDIIWQEVRI